MKDINWGNEVKKRKADIIKSTQDFLRINSVFDGSTASKTSPFGKGIDEALAHMLEKGKKDKFSVKNVDHYAGWIEFGSGEELVGVLCHIDVVPAGEGWTTPAFSADIRDGKLYARGAIDNKGPTMAAYYAMKIVQELGVPLEKRVRIILGTDEERDWNCVAHYAKKEEMPTIGFAPDADFPIIHAEKGIVDVQLSTKALQKGEGELILIQLTSGERFNMVPEQAEARLKGKQDCLRRVQEQYYKSFGEGASARIEKDILTLTYHGKSAHGSTPEKGINAGLKLCTFLKEISLQKEASTFINIVCTHLTEDFNGLGLGIFLEDVVSGQLTVNVGILQFLDGDEAKIGLNIRYPVTADGNDLIANLTKLVKGLGLKIEIINHMAPSYVEKSHPLIQTLQTVYERQTGEKAELLAIGGGTYARALDTGVAFGPLFPNREDVAHQKDEYITIDDLLSATAIYAEAIYELARH